VNRAEAVSYLLRDQPKDPKRDEGVYFAPANIALCKYWGKRNSELNLPYNSSLSISLQQYGAKTMIRPHADRFNRIRLNGQVVDNETSFAQKITAYLALFNMCSVTNYSVDTEINIPVGAGLASSACGFAALAGALGRLYDWELPKSTLSILGRLGSGSASRSFWHGFVEWQAGESADGMDSFGIPLTHLWPELRIGLLIFNTLAKPVSSREAMALTVATSPFYSLWPAKQNADLVRIKEAIATHNFNQLAETAEHNALTMHALMLTATPPILYSLPETLQGMKEVWHCRQRGVPVYFTQDAGPNLKLLFLAKDLPAVLASFPSLQVIAPFEGRDVA